jgi:hypothetical protein
VLDIGDDLCALGEMIERPRILGDRRDILDDHRGANQPNAA